MQVINYSLVSDCDNSTSIVLVRFIAVMAKCCEVCMLFSFSFFSRGCARLMLDLLARTPLQRIAVCHSCVLHSFHLLCDVGSQKKGIPCKGDCCYTEGWQRGDSLLDCITWDKILRLFSSCFMLFSCHETISCIRKQIYWNLALGPDTARICNMKTTWCNN